MFLFGLERVVSQISPYIYLLIPTSVCPIYMFKPYKTIHFLKPLLEGVNLEKSEFDLVQFPGISGIHKFRESAPIQILIFGEPPQ